MKFKSLVFASISCLLPLAANAEELKVFCYEGYVTQAVADGFAKAMKAKGIDATIKFTVISDPQEIFDALRGNKADIVTPSHNVVKSQKWKLIDNKMLAPLNLQNMPNYKSLIPSLQKAEFITEGDKTYGVPYTYGPYGLAYNTAIVKEEPTSWNVLLDPKYAGKFALSSDYHEANVYVAALASGVNKDQIGHIETLFNNPEVQKKLDYLAKNAKVLWKSVDTAKDLKGLALATSWGFALPELKKQGEVWKMAKPKEGVTGWVDSFSISSELEKNPKKLKLAEEFLNYMIGTEVQVGNIVRTLGSFPVNAAVKPLLTAEEVKTFKLDDPDFFRKEFILWKTLTVRDQNGMKVMWKRAKGES
ncbi:MAG TPA: ABC transporter substrate-binding protein [Rhodocyclaceae bacterium]|nr:ABC transporter substrate-binding protein [Rhodocyclaceae bacterium]